MLESKLKASGQVIVCLRGSDGKIKDRNSYSFVDNLVVTVGRQHIADQLSGQAEAVMSHMAIGSGSTVQVETNTTLTPQGTGANEISRKVFNSKDQGSGSDANKVIYVTNWAAGEGTGAIAEAGIFNAASGGVMLCRTTFPVKNKGAGDSLSLTWKITITS